MTQQTLLDSISSPADLRRLDVHQLPQLAQELRAFMVESVSKTGGHLSSSLGATELAIAIHTAFNTPEDRVIWDVGHQAYAHKILTGRREGMATLRKHHGLSGFPKRTESPYDAFGTAHSSTSISAALGMAIAARLEDKTDRWHIAVIGDGALTGGMALEALNDAGVWKEGVRLLVILNDNDCSISPPVVALSNHLAKIVSTRAYTCAREISKRVLKPVPGLWDIAKRMEKQAINFVSPPSGIFSSFDLNYYGPVDGHDVVGLVEVLKNLRRLNCPCVLHVATQKGKGYEPAEMDPTAYHGVGVFDPLLGLPEKKPGRPTYTEVFGRWLCDTAAADKRLYGITPATIPSAIATSPSPSSMRSPMLQALPARASSPSWRSTRLSCSVRSTRSFMTWRSRTCPSSSQSTEAVWWAPTARRTTASSTFRFFARFRT